MITLNARWLVVGLLWLTFAMGAASCAPVSYEPPPSPADVAEIHDAARNGNVENMRSLININADLANATDNYGNTPLMWAAEAGHRDVAELPLANNANAKNGIGNW